MRRRAAIATLALAAVLATAVAAGAQTQRGYTLRATVSPSAGGTPSKPVPVGVTLAAVDVPPSGNRPPVVAGFNFVLRGIRFNGGAFTGCSASQIAQAGTDAACPRGSRVGSGGIDIISGSSTDRRDRTIGCHLSMVVYGAGASGMTLFLTGSPSAAQPCYRSVSEPIPATAGTNRAGTTTISFRLPEALLHPLDGFDDAIVAFSGRVPVKLARVGSRRVGYLEAVGACSSRTRRRSLTATFVQESGTQVDANASVKCTPAPRPKPRPRKKRPHAAPAHGARHSRHHRR